ncbi:adenosine deaminase [Algicella marina]|uniref:Adenosine deaminase n=1 Tax=Algicella marina TaxID=2683284 RepID=A0A6P1SXE8_9RHOB|nr:adenosine deaminase [Algicella marina]QHQ34013.1 adenosine deaminase [Algicella marina]
MNWATIPKVELHLHLEGAAPPEFIRQLAREKNVELPGVFDEKGAYRWTDFAEFLRTYAAACSVLQGPEDFGRLAQAVLETSAGDGVIYTEIFIAPDICGGGDKVAWGEYLAALTEAARSAQASHGIVARFISTCIRNHGAEAAENAARLSAGTAGEMLTGFGMGGEERFGSVQDYVKAFAIAAEAGLEITSHAGEICGAESVRETLEHLPVSRIGHGVRAIEDPELVKRLADEEIVLEVNPGSNIALSVYDRWEAHPIQKLRDAGVPVTVSTDDPPYFHTDMPREYRRLHEVFGWDAEDFRAINLTAAHAAFCDEKTRSEIITRLTGA